MIILDGKKVRDERLEKLKDKVSDLSICLAVIQIGKDEASNIYINEKRKMCKYLDYSFKYVGLSDDATMDEVSKTIDNLNNDEKITGILLQLPIPNHLDSKELINKIDKKKDIDGLSDLSIANFYHQKNGMIPCTPKGVLTLLHYYNIDVAGKNIVIIGRSHLICTPLYHLLLNKDATITMCHSKTNNLKEHTLKADILITAVGKPNLITEDMVKDNAIVIDCGISRNNGKVVGDVDFINVSNKVSYITPVPGGVGPMTILSLAENLYEAYILK